MDDQVRSGDGSEGEKRILNEVTKENARERRNTLFKKGFAEDPPTLIEALPAVGKSYGVVVWAAQSGEPVSVFTERRDLYDQYEEWATDDFNLTARQLPVLHEDCPTAAEDINEDLQNAINRSDLDDGPEEWRNKVLQKYNQGALGRELHNNAEFYFGEKLPCQHDGSCPYMEALDRDVSNVDLLIGNFRQIFSEQYREDRYVVFDEFPNNSFIQEFPSTVVSKTVSNYVTHQEGLSFENWREVSKYDHERDPDSDVTEWLANRNHDRNNKPLYRGTGNQIDVRGPLLTEIVIHLSYLDNKWRRTDLGDSRIAVESPVSQMISLLDPPPIDEAKGVVALDGTPCVDKWKLLLGDDLQHHAVFTKDQKRKFLNEVLELRFVRTALTTYPYHRPGNVNADRDMALIEAIKEREKQKPSLISSKGAIEKYQGRNLSEFINECKHYNDLKGSNEFATERLGIVMGCPQPSDDDIQLWGALANRSIERKRYPNGEKTKGVDLDFGPFGNRILEDSRESGVLQAAMRFGRDEEDGERGATVYIHTTTLPDWVPVEEDIPYISAWENNEALAEVIEAIRDRDNWRTAEWQKSDLMEAIDSVGQRQVANLLKDPLAEKGYIESIRREGRGNAHVWSNKHLEKTGVHGLVSWEPHGEDLSEIFL